MTTRTEFSKKVKMAAFERAGGNCEKCTAKLRPGSIEYDHIIPCGIGGGGDIGNCQVLCTSCHRGAGSKTSADRAQIAKADRVRAKHFGAKPDKRNPVPGSRASGWKKKLNGEVVRRDMEG